MIAFENGTFCTFVLTLTEKQTLSAPNYAFVFTHRTTKEAVEFTLPNSADSSLYKKRYNRFKIEVNQYFLGRPEGMWLYEVYENTLNGKLLESGIMQLASDNTEPVFKGRTSDNTFIVRK